MGNKVRSRSGGSKKIEGSKTFYDGKSWDAAADALNSEWDDALEFTSGRGERRIVAHFTDGTEKVLGQFQDGSDGEQVGGWVATDERPSDDQLEKLVRESGVRVRESFEAKDHSFSGLPTIYSKEADGNDYDYAVIVYDKDERTAQLVHGKTEDDWVTGGHYRDFDTIDKAVNGAQELGYSFDAQDVKTIKDFVASKGEHIDDTRPPDEDGDLVANGNADIEELDRPILVVAKGAADISESSSMDFVNKILPKFKRNYPNLTAKDLSLFLFGGGTAIGTSEDAKNLHHDYDGQVELMVQDGLLTKDELDEFDRLYDGDDVTEAMDQKVAFKGDGGIIYGPHWYAITKDDRIVISGPYATEAEGWEDIEDEDDLTIENGYSVGRYDAPFETDLEDAKETLKELGESAKARGSRKIGGKNVDTAARTGHTEGGSSRGSSSRARVMEADDDVDRITAVLQVGDFIKMGMDGSDDVAARAATTLELRGHVGLDFKDPYAALNVLNDDDLSEIYNFALAKGMMPLNPTTAPAETPEVTS